MAKLGYHIAAGMMQGLGAGIIENAKQQREAALRAMDLQARREEGAAERASREALSAKELASREAQHTAEIGMRKGELEGARKDRELAREENAQYRKDTLAETKRYHDILDTNNDARTGMVRDPNKVTDEKIIESILTEVDKSKDIAGRPTKKAEELAARYPDRPEVLKRFGVQVPKEGTILTAPTEKPPAAGGGGAAPKDDLWSRLAPHKLKVDALKADLINKRITQEEFNRQIDALLRQ